MKRFLLTLAMLSSVGCATVEPWERDTHSTTRMQVDVDPDETYLVTTRQRVREEGIIGTSGSSGGSSAAGGGCGCH